MLKSRLKKIANSEDEMSFDEIKEDTLKAIDKMKTMVAEWAVRDILKDFTQWDFYAGDAMTSINGDIAKDICQQLTHYVNSIDEREAELLYEVEDKVQRYMY